MYVRFAGVFVFLSFYIINFPMTPAALRGTYEIFSQCSQHLSPLQGAILWESGVVKNYYDAGMAAKSIPGVWLPEADGPIRLVRALFTDTLGSFDVSHNPNYPAKHLGISTLASIIALLEVNRREPGPLDGHFLENLIIRDPEFAQSVSDTSREREGVRESYDTLMRQAESLGKKEQVAQLKYSSTIALNKLDTQRLFRDWSRQQSIAQLRARILEIDQLIGKEKAKTQKERSQKEYALASLEAVHGGGDYNRVYELANAIIDAHKPSIYYSCHIADWIMLAAMYRKAKSKQDLGLFITLLAKKLGARICYPIDDSWLSKLYTQSDFDFMRKQMLFWEQSAIPDHISSADYEGMAYAQIMGRYYQGPFPKIAEYLNVSVHGTVFPDCMEVTLFNFCNMVLYDRQAGTFDLTHVPLVPTQALADFYNDPMNKQSANVGLPSVHESWAKLLQNMPLVTYRRLIFGNADGTQTLLTASKDTNGFIYGLPETILSQLKHDGERVLIAGRWYIHVIRPDAYLCEMHPTIRNVIIVLNKFFNLNLFGAEPVEQALISDRCNARYFPLVCQHFSLLQGMQWTEVLLTMLDRDEYTDKGILLAYPKFDLLLTDEHAEIIVGSKGDTIADIGPQLSRFASDAAHALMHDSMAQLLALFPFAIGTLSQPYQYRYLLYVPLYSNQVKIMMAIFCIQKLLDQTLSAQDRTYLTDRAINFMRQLPERLDWHYHEELIRKLDLRAFGYEFVRQEIERILSVAKNRLASVVPADCEYVPLLYLALIAQGQVRDDVMIVIDNLLARPEPFDRKPLLHLLIELVKQGRAIEQAGKAVKQCINNTVPAERLLAQKLGDILPK